MCMNITVCTHQTDRPSPLIQPYWLPFQSFSVRIIKRNLWIDYPYKFLYYHVIRSISVQKLRWEHTRPCSGTAYITGLATLGVKASTCTAIWLWTIHFFERGICIMCDPRVQRFITVIGDISRSWSTTKLLEQILPIEYTQVVNCTRKTLRNCPRHHQRYSFSCSTDSRRNIRIGDAKVCRLIHIQ